MFDLIQRLLPQILGGLHADAGVTTKKGNTRNAHKAETGELAANDCPPPGCFFAIGGLRFHHQMQDWWKKSGDIVSAWGSRIMGHSVATLETNESSESNPVNVLVVHSLEED